MKPLNHQLEQLAKGTNTSLAYNQKLFVLEALLSQISEILLQKEKVDFVFRGSLILRNWVFPNRRLVNDLDLLGTISYDIEACRQLVIAALKLRQTAPMITFYTDYIVVRKTWEDTASPGVRIYIPFSFMGQNNFIQIDFGFGDSIYPAPFMMDYKNVIGERFTVPTVSVEVALAWKVHGLFEFWDRGRSWSPKTLYDIDLILTHLKIDTKIFRRVLMTAFQERKTPLSTYKRVLRREFGRSKGSHRSWKRFIKRNGLTHIKESQIDLIERHRSFLDPFFV